MFIPKRARKFEFFLGIANTGKDELNSTIRNDILIV